MKIPKIQPKNNKEGERKITKGVTGSYIIAKNVSENVT